MQPKHLQEQIDVGQFCHHLLLVRHPSSLRARHILEHLLSQRGDERLLLLHRRVQGIRCEELPDGLVKRVGLHLVCVLGLFGGWECGDIHGEASRREKERQVWEQELEDVVEEMFPKEGPKISAKGSNDHDEAKLEATDHCCISSGDGRSVISTPVARFCLMSSARLRKSVRKAIPG